MAKSAGPPPDYQGAAAQTQQASQQAIGQQTQANRPNQVTPWGSTQWTQGPNGEWTQKQQLDPGLQGLMDQAKANYGQGMDWSQFGPMETGEAARKAATEASYGQATSRLDPQWQLREQRLKAQLAATGNENPENAAYQNEMDVFNRGRNDAYNQAQFGSQLAGIGAGQAAFQQGLQGRQQQIGEAMTEYNQPMQGLTSLLGTSGALNMPGFMGAGAWNPGNYLAAAGMLGQFNLDSAQQQNEFWGDVMGGASKLGSAAMGIPGLF
jgi:hypothetical protein